MRPPCPEWDFRETERAYPELPCPVCQGPSRRHATCYRTLVDLLGDRAVRVLVRFTKHYCPACHRYFSAPVPHGPHRGRFTFTFIRHALDLIEAKRLSYKEAAAVLWKRYGVRVAHGSIHNWMLDREEFEQEAG